MKNISIDVAHLLETFALNPDNVSGHLFPLNKHPKAALTRIILGDALLNSDQMFKLAALTNMTVSDLYKPDTWVEREADTIQVFTFGDYEAHLSVVTWVTTIFHKGSLYYSNVLHSGELALSEYFQLINNKIKTDDESND